MESIRREILQSFWKIHVLHHTAEGPVYGQWMLHELREHGYDVIPANPVPDAGSAGEAGVASKRA